MSEQEVYGGRIASSYYDAGINKSQLTLFNLRKSHIVIRSGWWLRSVSSATSFAHVGAYGDAVSHTASYALYVRPLYLMS